MYEMYLCILLLVGSVTAAVEDRFLIGVLEDIVDATPEQILPVDARLNITQLARKYGYNLEEHTVTTEDGYILNFHRIPNDPKVTRPIVFLMHGVLESSDSWVLMGPKRALAYVLAEQGFDVWMGNSRGNKHASAHTTLDSSKDGEYWQFSWDEIALYDLPAMIDYILKETGYSSLYYVGHSQGTTVGYVLCSMRPEYNEKIKMMFSLAPEAWMGHAQSPLVKMLTRGYARILKNFQAVSAGIHLLRKVALVMCRFMPRDCDSMLNMLAGETTKIDPNFLSVILGHAPTGSSALELLHYGQLYQSHQFCRYDFGAEKNKLKYGQIMAPDYNLNHVTVPVVIFYSGKDWLSDVLDVKILMENLPNVNDTVFIEDFTHLDYVYASEAVDVIYSRIIRKINETEGYQHNLGLRARNWEIAPLKTPLRTSDKVSQLWR